MSQNIWWGEGPKVFISHASSTRHIAGELKDKFANLGISAFVAHEDINVTEQWQEVILNALSSMDVFLPILSEDFKESNYCDQELGFATAERRRQAGRTSSILIIPFMFDGTAPYGFISNEQAAKIKQVDDIPSKVLDTLSDKQFDLWFEFFVQQIHNSRNFRHSNHTLAPKLAKIVSLTAEQAAKIDSAVKGNLEVYNAWDFMAAYHSMLENIDSEVDSLQDDDLPW